MISLSSELKKYLVIGISVYVFELAVILVAQALGAGPILAVGLSFWLGLCVSFWLQKLVTFGDKRMGRKILSLQVLIYSLLVLFNFGFTILVTALLRHVWPAVLSRSLALGVTTFWNFYLYKTRLFKTDAPLFD